MIYFLCIVLGNYFLGACVCAIIDDEKQSLFNWYCRCPEQIAWFVQPLTVSLWPVVMWFWFKHNPAERPNIFKNRRLL